MIGLALVYIGLGLAAYIILSLGVAFVAWLFSKIFD